MESVYLYMYPPFEAACPWCPRIEKNSGTPYNPLVADVMEEVFGPTAGEDRPQLHPHAQPALQTLMEIV